MLKTPPPAGHPSTRKKKAKKALDAARQRKQRFDAAHVKGMKALNEMDHIAASMAISEEAEILKEERAYIADNQREAAARAQKFASRTAGSKKAKKAKKKR